MKINYEKKAKEILDFVIENSNFPSNVKVSKENKNWTLSVTLKNSFGETGEFTYKPNTRSLEKYLEHFEKINKIFEDKGKKEFAQELTETLAATACEGLLNIFYADIEETFQNFHQTSQFIIHQILSKVLSETDEIYQLRENTDEDANKIKYSENSKLEIKDFIKSRHKSIFNLVEHFKETSVNENLFKPHKQIIDCFYSDLLPEWKEAKKFYRQNKHFNNWHEIAKIAFPHLPEDLLTLLSDPDVYLSMPSALALEHAARLCGFRNDSISHRNLQHYL